MIQPGKNFKLKENKQLTGVAAADHEDAGGNGYVLSDEGAESGVALVPIEGSGAVRQVTSVPVEGVPVAARAKMRRRRHRDRLPRQATVPALICFVALLRTFAAGIDAYNLFMHLSVHLTRVHRP